MNANQHASLPVPDTGSLARSTLLSARIASEIAEAGGWLPFSQYMERVLYTPGLGYYSGANVKFGRTAADGSDFITAPEISPFFGRALARPIAEALALAESNEIIEFGAGTGKLAAELLNTLGTACQCYTIIELSGELRERQKAMIAERAPALAARVRWLDRLPESFSGVVIGNEVLDAMPIQLYAYRDGQWFERGVGLDHSHIVWQERPIVRDAKGHIHIPDLSDALRRQIEADGLDYLAETHAAARAFVSTVCAMLERGAAIFIDYGFPAHEYYHPQRANGTLMCHFRHHAHDNPLLYPGLQDVTAHVDFSGIAEAALDAGADVLGYMSQARFLINAGIAEQLRQAVDPTETARYLPAANGVQKLLAESEMGELFKVIGFSRGLSDAPQAFIDGDRSWTLLPEEDDTQP